MNNQKRTNNKIVAIALVMALLLCCVPVYANSGEEIIYTNVNSYDEIDWSQARPNEVFLVPNENVTNIEPGQGDPLYEQLTRGASIPYLSKELKVGGTRKYNFSGTASVGFLYTQYKFYGSRTYTIGVTNRGSTAVIARCTTSSMESGILKDITVESGKTAYKALTVSSASTKWFIGFTYPSSVSGYVQAESDDPDT